MTFTYSERPHRVYWEITRACDLACRHCRATAVPDASPLELSNAEGTHLLEQLTAFGDPLPHVVLTGGDALKRGDLFELIAMARGLGFGVSVAPSATPLLTADAIRRLREAGVEAISLSLDGSTAERHDAIRGIAGTFQRTLDAARAARSVALLFQVNTLVCAETADDLPAIHERVVAMGAARWSLFFLVNVGRGEVLASIPPEHAEAVLNWAATLNGHPGSTQLLVTTTEAPHIRRIVAERRRQRPGSADTPPSHAHRGAGIRDGNGVMFISHTGEICPSGFLELSAGNVRERDVVEVYRADALFNQLRDPAQFEGRCGRCEFHWLCGGSRARAYATSGNPFAEDPLCTYDSGR
ncbi:MAG TPA: TIGR04053 family radical SAM/SPASM domain-containing protein [Vicinamibacterales bacterium]|nr:TIGR04053 family radical SAM/SPASM domain-containing protein [Vicinamibacterales bacterium]